MHRYCLLLLVAALAGCVTAPPRATSNVCDIFYEKGGWFDDADAAFLGHVVACYVGVP